MTEGRRAKNGSQDSLSEQVGKAVEDSADLKEYPALPATLNEGKHHSVTMCLCE